MAFYLPFLFPKNLEAHTNMALAINRINTLYFVVIKLIVHFQLGLLKKIG